MALNTGVINLLTPVNVPACNIVVVVESAYQSMVIPVAAVAETVAVSGPHLVALTTVVTAAGRAFTVTETAVRVVEPHPVFLDSA